MDSCIYHGSNVEVATPRILQNGFYKDFGYGFYCTNIKKQAIRWAITKNGASILNRYTYKSDSALNVLTFPEMSEEWLDFVARCQAGTEHNYVIVEGPMAVIKYGIRWNILLHAKFQNCFLGISKV